MARRIRWQIVIAVVSLLMIFGLMARLALSNTSVANPLSGGRLVEAVIGAPRQLIPHFNDPLADPAGQALGALLFDGLTRIGADGLIDPALAAEFQSDPSGEVYTFRLRRDVRWHDGTPFSADDVVFTLRMLQDPRFNGDEALANLWRNVLVDRVDDYTVRLTLRAPYAGFPALARVPILPAHLLSSISADQIAESAFARNPIGTGPFRLAELNEQGARLEANPDYFGGAPYIEQLEQRYIATQEAALALLQRGEVQALGGVGGLPQSGLPRTLRRAAVPLDGYTMLTINLREAPLSDVTLRRALARALDRNLLIDQVLGGAGVALDTPILPGWWAYDPESAWYAYDPPAALRTLTELGYEPGADGILRRDGETLTLELITDGDPERMAAALEIARQWSELGVGIELRQLEPAELRRRLAEHDFTLALHSWARLGPDPDVFELWHSSQAEQGLNYAGLRDEPIDALLSGARSESDIVARRDNYVAFQQRWVELAPSIMLYQPLYTFAYDEQLGGLGFSDEGSVASLLLVGREDRYRSVQRWFVNSTRELPGTLSQ